MIKIINKSYRFELFDDKYNWIEALKSNYHKLSDYLHIRGLNKGTQALCNIQSYFSSSFFHNINLKTFHTYIQYFIETVENIVILISLYNPITLISLPLEEKFGDREPLGFIHPYQIEKLNLLIPRVYKPFFEKIKEHDEEVKSLVEWVYSLPSQTES